MNRIAIRCMEAKRAGWKSTKHAAQWASTLQTYAYPVFGNIPIQDVTTDLVLAALTPIWSTKNETARRVRQRIETVLSWASAMRQADGRCHCGALEHDGGAG